MKRCAGNFTVIFLIIVFVALPAFAQQKPNILILWGDDIGYWNVSAYNQGMMGYKTPNIDRIAHEGALFTDWYGQQSCTAGRAAFITGQSPIRTGLTKVGLPGAPEGLQQKDPTIAELLKPLGYATGQFGKNHLGDRNDFLPTVHGFDVFFGNLYHLNATRTRGSGLSEEPSVQREVRSPRRIALRRNGHGEFCAARPALRCMGQAVVRRHRRTHHETYGDHRRGDYQQHNRVYGEGP